MATNFPNSVDNLTNPTTSDTLASVSHSGQHADANDAIEAIETALLDGAPLHIDDTNERVGIGTTSPSTDLHVSNNNPTITLQATANGNSPLLSLEGKRGTTGTATKVEFNARQTGALDINVDPDDSDADADSYFKVAVDGADAFHIDSEGRVGIGTTSPSAPLEILGSNGAESLRLSSPFNSAGQEVFITGVDSNDGGIVAAIGLGIDSNGANDNDGCISFRVTSSASGSVPSTNMYIDKDGDVGIGVTSITNKFEVYNGTYYPIIARKDWGLRSTGTYALSTSAGANVYISTNGTFYRSTSSGKYKTDVEDMDTSAANVVFALRPVWFRSTSPHDPEGWSYYGLIAEEVAEVDPRLVSFGAREDCGCDFDADHVAECLTEPEGVYYDRLVPHLISVVQRQQEQIDALTARIEALEAG